MSSTNKNIKDQTKPKHDKGKNTPNGKRIRIWKKMQARNSAKDPDPIVKVTTGRKIQNDGTRRD